MRGLDETAHQKVAKKRRPQKIRPDKSQTLLRKAGAGSRSLAGLELRVRLADHIDRSFAFHDLAICVTALGGGK
jgi:hypothetical protein